MSFYVFPGQNRVTWGYPFPDFWSFVLWTHQCICKKKIEESRGSLPWRSTYFIGYFIMSDSPELLASFMQGEECLLSGRYWELTGPSCWEDVWCVPKWVFWILKCVHLSYFLWYVEPWSKDKNYYTTLKINTNKQRSQKDAEPYTRFA